jgi:hypothetical protein
MFQPRLEPGMFPIQARVIVASDILLGNRIVGTGFEWPLACQEHTDTFARRLYSNRHFRYKIIERQMNNAQVQCAFALSGLKRINVI